MSLVRSNSRLGAYPTDPYYNPNRPGWVPYWIDTPTESEAKYAWIYGVTPGQITDPTSYPSPPMPTAPRPPSDIEHPGPGAVDEVIRGKTQADRDQVQAFFSQLADQIAAEKRNTEGHPWLIVGAVLAAIALVMLLKRR